MKKLFVSVVILLIWAFVITGCSNASPTPSKPVATWKIKIIEEY
jgi:hypothetical protein